MQGDAHVQAEECLAFGPPSSIVDEVEEGAEDGSSRNPQLLTLQLLTPKVEGGLTRKKRKSGVEANPVESAKKVKGCPDQNREIGIPDL
jgi:hypothetical protein